MEDEVQRPGTADGIPPLVKWMLALVGAVVLFVLLIDLVTVASVF
jgi:hypothetical protein